VKSFLSKVRSQPQTRLPSWMIFELFTIELKLFYTEVKKLLNCPYPFCAIEYSYKSSTYSKKWKYSSET